MSNNLTALHVYAGPFPSRQGTQVLVDSICRESFEDGLNTHLLCYDGSAASDEPSPFIVHRIRPIPGKPPMRSGPSLRRLPRDVLLTLACKKLIKQLSADILHAHHYEALLACALARGPASSPALVFHCHALLGYELDSYFQGRFGALTRFSGNLIDARLPRLADAIAGVSPFVALRIREQIEGRVPVDYVPAYVEPLAAPHGPLDLKKEGEVTGVYTGNLDGYQEIPRLLTALETLPPRARRRLRFVFSTSSSAVELERALKQRRLHDLVRIQKEKTVRDAALVLEHADFAVIPRSRPGGIPVKLINALGAGVPCIVDRRIAQHLLTPSEAMFVDSADAESLGAAIVELTQSPKTRDRLRVDGMRCYEREFSLNAARDARRRLYERVLARRGS